MTWRNDIGLKLYMDGKEVASDTQGKEIELQLNTKKPNLCFGRDVQGDGHFAKFTIGSFSTFNTFLSPSIMANVYTFFFRSGKLPTFLLNSDLLYSWYEWKKTTTNYQALIFTPLLPCCFWLVKCALSTFHWKLLRPSNPSLSCSSHRRLPLKKAARNNVTRHPVGWTVQAVNSATQYSTAKCF